MDLRLIFTPLFALFETKLWNYQSFFAEKTHQLLQEMGLMNEFVGQKTKS